MRGGGGSAGVIQALGAVNEPRQVEMRELRGAQLRKREILRNVRDAFGGEKCRVEFSRHSRDAGLVFKGYIGDSCQVRHVWTLPRNEEQNHRGSLCVSGKKTECGRFGGEVRGSGVGGDLPMGVCRLCGIVVLDGGEELRRKRGEGWYTAEKGEQEDGTWN